MALKKTLAEMEQSVPESETRKMLGSFFDEGTFVETDKFLSADGEISSVIAGYGNVNGVSVFAFAQDVSVRSGAVDKYASKKIKRVYEAAAKAGNPVVGFYNSKGGDIGEGMTVLSDYGEILSAAAKLSGVVPQIAVVTGVCAGCAAMLAATADVVVATEKSELFLTSPFNNEDGKLEGAGTAKNAAKSGVCHILAKDNDDAVKQAQMLLALVPSNNLEEPYCLIDAETSDGNIPASAKGMALVKAFADKDTAVELGAEFGKAAVTALASVNSATVAFVTTDNAEKLTSADCAKIARFVEFADSFSIPVVTVLNTQGFEGSSAAELAGSVRDCARLAQVYANATTAKITLVTGKAYGAAFAAFSSADMIIALDGSEIAPMNPEALKVFSGEERDTSAFAAAEAGLVSAVIDISGAYEAVLGAISVYSGKREDAPHRKHANLSL